MTDPYVYPGTDVLRNKLDIRDANALEAAERLLTLQRHREGFPRLDLTPGGYRALHRHLFQDLYEWAGEPRTVNIHKDGSTFCLVPHILAQLARCFAAIRAASGLRGLSANSFAPRAAAHIGELNAIHPFRDWNGRTLRAFLVSLAHRAGHRVELPRIEPEAWNYASRESFMTGDPTLMRDLIANAVAGPALNHETGRASDKRGRRTPLL